jgi:hypothetical protein
MANNGYAELLLDALPSDSDEEMQKGASEAAAGEIFGRMTKQAEQEIVGTVGWAGQEQAAQMSAVLGERVLIPLAKIAGNLNLATKRLAFIMDKMAEISGNEVPMDSHDMPKVDPMGIGEAHDEQGANQDTSIGVFTPSGEGYPGKPEINKMVDDLLKADVLTNTTPSGASNNPPGEQPELFDPGHTRTAAFEGARAAMGKVENLFNKGRAAAKSVGKAVSGAAGKAKAMAGAAGEKVREGAEAAARTVKKYPGRAAAGAGAAGAAAGFAAGRMSKKEGSDNSDLASRGARFRQSLLASLGEDEE